MASDNSAAKAAGLEHQDQSIKARKVQLFEDGKPEEVVETRRPFSYYVLQTPPSPMAPAVKAYLWATAVLVVLLFLAAFFIGPHQRPRRRHAALTPGQSRPVAVTLRAPLAYPGLLGPERG